MATKTLLSERNLQDFIEGSYLSKGLEDAVSRVNDELGSLQSTGGLRIVRALFAVKEGHQTDKVARFLDWRDFEAFCSVLLRARGYNVTEDLRLKRPRAQIDILARSQLISLLIDCKHWAKERGTGTLGRAADKQGKRAREVRRKMENLEPIAVVILALSNEQTRFVNGAAVVPVRTLGDFLDNLGTYSQQLTLY